MDAAKKMELTDKLVYPDEKVLRKVLGKAYTVYSRLLKLYNDNEMVYEWRYYKDGKAWLCKVQKKKKTVVWMSAWKGYIQAVIYVPEKHIKELYALDLSKDNIANIKKTKNIGKSKPVIFKLKSIGAIIELDKVIQLKISLK